MPNLRRLIGLRAVNATQSAEAVGEPQPTVSRWVRELCSVEAMPRRPRQSSHFSWAAEVVLPGALQRAGYALSQEQCAAVRARRHTRTNTSRRRAASYYYDAASIDLIARREALIIGEHGYVPPAADGAA